MTPMTDAQPKRLTRSSTERILAGICGGIGQYFNIDPTIVRIIFVVLALSGGIGIGLYIALWIIMPQEGATVTSIGERVQSFQSDVKGTAERITTETRGTRTGDGRRWFAVTLILVGGIALAQRLLPWPLFRWEVFWPGVVILLGLLLIFKRS